MKKMSLILILSILFQSAFFANETIVIKIMGEEYEREYPTSMEEYKSFVDDMVDMYNSLDSAYMKYIEESKSSDLKLKELVTELETSNETIKLKLNIVVSDFTTYKKNVDSLLKKKTKFTTFLGIGPTLSFDGIGSRYSITGEYRIFSNLHIGLNLGLNVYNNSVTNNKMQGDISFKIGYSLF